MKQDKKQLQATLFGDFTLIKPNAETIKHFMEGFPELSLIPSVLEMPETRPQMGLTFQIGPAIRFLFRSEDGRWTITFQDERVSIAAKKDSPESSDLPNPEAFIKQALAIFASIDSRLDTGYTRLSYVTKHFLLDGTQENLNTFFAKKFGESKFYSENDPRDWQFRISARKTLASIPNEEANVITQIVRQRVSIPDELKPRIIEGIDCTFDINTAEENQESRFTIDNFSSFLSEVSILEKELQDDILVSV